MSNVRGSKSKRTEGQRSTRGRAKADWKGYVNLTLTDSDKQRFTEATINEGDTFHAVSRLVEAGYKVSVGYDDYNDAFVGSIYGVYADMDNGGWCLTIRGKSAISALQRAIYVHFSILAENYGNAGISADTEDRW